MWSLFGGVSRDPPPFMYQSKHFDITPWFWCLSKLLLYKKEFLTLLVKFLRCLMDSLYIVGNWCILDSCCYFCSWVSFPRDVLNWRWYFVLIEITEGTMSMLIKEEYHLKKRLWTTCFWNSIQLLTFRSSSNCSVEGGPSSSGEAALLFSVSDRLC